MLRPRLLGCSGALVVMSDARSGVRAAQSGVSSGAITRRQRQNRSPTTQQRNQGKRLWGCNAASSPGPNRRQCNINRRASAGTVGWKALNPRRILSDTAESATLYTLHSILYYYWTKRSGMHGLPTRRRFTPSLVAASALRPMAIPDHPSRRGRNACVGLVWGLRREAAAIRPLTCCSHHFS
jgi:hypothetical protein